MNGERYHEGFGDGYAEGESDVVGWVDETLAEWHGLKIYTHEELWAAQELLAELRLRVQRSASSRGAE